MQRLRTWSLDRPRGELAAHLGLMVVGFLLRAIDLGDRPFHHDESQDAYFSWVFFDRGDYEYNPLLHGPVRFYLTALMYVLFGDSDFTARLAPALMGTLMIGLPFLLRRQIGRGPALFAALFLTFGPTYLYFSRFAREDIYIACINLALLVAVFRFIDRPRTAGTVAIGILTALAFGTKETTFITLFVAGTFLMPAALWQWRRGGGKLLDAVRAVGWVGWAYALAAFVITFTLLFTVFLTNPPGLWDGIHDGLDYWLGQHEVGRGGEPWYFYFAVLFGHEWPMLVLGAAGAVVAVRQRSFVGAFLVWAFVLSLAVYSWAGEKFAWLTMHPLLPLVLLAGIGAHALWTARARAARLAGVAAVGVCVAYAGYASFLANAEHRADPREFLVSTQSSEDVKEVVDNVYNLDRRVRARNGGRPITITIDTAEGATYPWAWYFRHLGVGYIDLTQPGYVPQAEVLIMTETAQRRMLPDLAAYDGRRFRFRVWWVRDWTRKFDAGAWWNWFTERKTWNPVGGMPEWVYVRRDAAAS